MRADVIRRISKVWRNYQEFLETESLGDVSLREMMETAPDKEAKWRTVSVVCGEPPFKDMNCALLAWEVDRGRL